MDKKTRNKSGSGKRQVTLICLAQLLVAFMLTSCAAQRKGTQHEDTLDRIRRTGKIDVCTFVYPPFGIKDSKTGAFSGIYIDAINAIAEKMNAKVVLHEVGSGNAVADLVSGRCDVEPGLFALIPRAASVSFTQPPLLYIGESALVRRDDRRFTKATSVFEFDRPDITVALLNGESGDIFVKENFKKAQTKRIDADSSDQTRFCVEVSARRADVAIADSNTLHLYAKNHPEVVELFYENPFGLNPVSWGVRQDDAKWLHFLETALQFLETQGTLEQLDKKYHARFLHVVKEYKMQ